MIYKPLTKRESLNLFFSALKGEVMKRIIGRKMYDTETADRVFCEDFSTPGDFHHSFKSLYQTSKGNYFFYGGGGPMSEYAVDLGNNNTGGSDRLWLPEDEDEVFTWLSDVDPDKALELFSEKIQDA